MSFESQAPETTTSASPNQSLRQLILAQKARQSMLARKALFILIVFLAGFGGGYFTGRRSTPATEAQPARKAAVNVNGIFQPEGYTIPAVFGNIGPQMVASGAIDLPRFIELYKQNGHPLSDEQLAILTKESNSPIVINQQNANFLLNFFWAFGLANKNPILTEGQMMSGGKDKAGNFASTGGWTLGTKAPMDLYASTTFLPLTEDQQARVLKVASSVYRPCCDNPTHFPDCNHGMAMLGLLELMASQDASEAELFNAAKYVNAYWFPQQTLEIATYLKANQKVEFAQAEASLVVSRRYSSGSGFKQVHQWLADNGLLEQAPGSGGSCAVQ